MNTTFTQLSLHLSYTACTCYMIKKMEKAYFDEYEKLSHRLTYILL